MNNRLRIIREQKGLSQLELSRMTGIAGNIISNIENRKIFFYPGWKMRIAVALCISESDLEEEGGNGNEPRNKSL
jgi:transcriptional regulator with XRE-family HTH domain